MKTLPFLRPLLLLSLFILAACQNESSAPLAAKSTESPSGAIELIQFHSEHRCMTCNKIELLTAATLDSMGLELNFRLVNVDLPENEAEAEAFEAYGTALFLHHPQSKAKKNLTEFAFMNAGNEERFKSELSREIQAFQKAH